MMNLYHGKSLQPSAFFQSIALVDPCLKYFGVKRPVGEDLTVGAKPKSHHFVGLWAVLREFRR